MGFEKIGVELIAAGVATFVGGVRTSEKAVVGLGGTIKGAAGRVSPLTKGLGALAKGVGVLAVSAGTAAAGGLAVLGVQATKTAISVESAFAGVIKTTDGLVDSQGDLTESGEEIRQGFRDLAKEVPLAIEELFAIGELAGQLGVPKEALVDFTESVTALGVATNLTEEEAATALAQIANIFQISAADMATNTEQVGSALVALGNNFATTEADILSFGSRIAGAGQIAGLTQDQVLAIGAALSSVGVEAAAGGTAVQKVLLAMNEAVVTGNEDLATFAETAGQSAEEFATAFEQDAAGAFSDFVQGLGEAGDDAIGVLDDLGLSDQRLIRSFLSLANAGDLLDRTLDTANQGFEENTALAKEAATRYATTESQIEILKNTFRDLALTIGDALLPFFQDLLEQARPVITEIGERLPGILEEFVIPAIQNLVAFGGQLVAWLSETLPGATEQAGGFLAGLAETFAPIWDAVQNLVAVFMESWPMIQATVSEAWTVIKEIIDRTLPVIVENVTNALNALAAFWDQHGAKIMAVISFAFKTIAAVISSTIAVITGIITAFTQLISGDIEGFKETVVNTFRTLFENALSIVGQKTDEFIDTWRGVFELGKTIVSTFVDNIVTAIRDGISRFVTAGKDLVQGLIDGLKQKFSDALQLVKDKIQEIKDATADLLGLGSPSRVYKVFGREMMEGLAIGIAEGLSDPLRNIQLATAALATGTQTAPVLTTPTRTVSNVTNVNINATYEQLLSPADIALDVQAALAASRL